MEGIMLRTVWNGAVLAESEHTVKVEGNHYFPAESLHREYFADSPTTSTCPWKGRARYYHVSVDGTVNRDAAWYYPQPGPAAPGRGAAVSPAAGAPGGVLVHWRPGCPYCAMLRLGLRSARVPATWVNIGEDRAAAARVRHHQRRRDRPDRRGRR